MPVAGLNLALALLTAFTTVVAMRTVGVLLVSAMIVIPALAGFALGRSFRRATGWAVVVALVSVTVGLVAAFYLRLAEPDTPLWAPTGRYRRRPLAPAPGVTRSCPSSSAHAGPGTTAHSKAPSAVSTRARMSRRRAVSMT